MWHPNQTQWWVILVAVILGLVFGQPGGGGIVGFAIPVLIGALLVWQLEGRRKMN